MTTAKDICEGVPKTLLDSQVDDVHLAELAHDMEEWEELAPFLGLTPAEESAIVEKYRGRLRLQIREALRMWKKKRGSQASYKALIIVFCLRKRVDWAEKVKALSLTAEEKQPGTANNELDTANKTQPGLQVSSPAITSVFRDYLHDCYDIPQPPSWPNLDNKGYVALDLQEAPVKPNAANELKNWEPIVLESLFSAGNSQPKRKVILVEGVAGVGKTTLSWHAMKKWAKGEIFQDIELLIHVSLGDPDIQRATKLSDLVPHPSDEMRSKVADAIAASGGKNVCFWLDGLDEAPLPFWQSFLYQFISGTGGRARLSSVSIVLTSRPEILVKLSTILTGKVVIKGFQSIDQYVAAYSLENKDQLLEALEMKPELYSICHIPLNAAIMIYLYDELKDNLPTTRTGLFDPLVRHTVLRHMLTRTSHAHPNVQNFPANLPKDIRSSLSKVSNLAFYLIKERQKIMTREKLAELGIDSTNDIFGLLRARLRFTMYGPDEQLSFAHLSLQEFLAAFHISQMHGQQQQVEAIKVVFDQNPDSPVLTFYAGLTKLEVDAVRDIFFKALSKPYDAVGVVEQLGLNENPTGPPILTADAIQDTLLRMRPPANVIRDILLRMQNNPSDAMGELEQLLYENPITVDPTKDPRRHLLCLINGLYEAQEPDLLTIVKLRVTRMGDVLGEKAYASNLDKEPPGQAYITFSFMNLYPTDCLSIGYFIRHTCESDHQKSVNKIHLDLSNISLKERELKALTQELCKPTSSHNVFLELNCNFSTNSLDALYTLFNHRSCLQELELDMSKIDNVQLAMKYIILGCEKSHCRSLTLREYPPSAIHYLILLLRRQHVQIELLNLPQGDHLFAMPGAMKLFAEAVRYSKLRSLYLFECDINDELLMTLGVAVCHEICSLNTLKIDKSPKITERGLSNLLKLILRELEHMHVHLTILSVDCVNDEHNHLVNNVINKLRQSMGYSDFILGSESKEQEEDEEIQKRFNGYDSLMIRKLQQRSPHH